MLDFNAAGAVYPEPKDKDFIMTNYRFIGVDRCGGLGVQLHFCAEGANEMREVVKQSNNPAHCLRLLNFCTPESIGDLYAAAFFAEAIRTLPEKEGKPDWSKMPDSCFVFSGLWKVNGDMQARFSTFRSNGGNLDLFFMPEQGIRDMLETEATEATEATQVVAYCAALQAFASKRGAVPVAQERLSQFSAVTATQPEPRR